MILNIHGYRVVEYQTIIVGHIKINVIHKIFYLIYHVKLD